MSKILYYLATPYTHYGQGREQAFKDAAIAAASLLKKNMLIYSPITHSHPIAMHGGIDPADHGFWLPISLAMLDQCDALLVVQMPGWRESKGVASEIARATETDKPICYLSWPMLNVREDEGGSDLPRRG